MMKRLPALWLLFSFLVRYQHRVAALSATTTSSPPKKVLVTGAAGRTGQLVFDALLKDPRYEPIALVRSEGSAKKLRKSSNCNLDQICICDVTTLGKEKGAQPPAGLEGCHAIIICTSAVPVISKLSLFAAMIKAPLNMFKGKKALDFRSLKFVWKNGQYPELVDYQGQVAQIDLAIRTKMKHVVVVSSMGGTDPTNFLNSVGKNPDGTGNGDILLWKRKAERYLVESGLDYTIIHPGGLTEGPAGQEDFVLDVDDKLLQNKKRSISRADVANLCVAALTVADGRKLAFDCITREVTDKQKRLRTAEEALAEFVKQSKAYNYAI